MGSFKSFWCFFAVTILALCVICTTSEVTIPPKCRTEGRITLTYQQGDSSSVNHHLAFSETIDEPEGKSVITIGYPSHQPRKYFTGKFSNTITIDENGVCKTSEKDVGFIPELSWFIDIMLQKMDIDQYLMTARHSVGPTGLARLFVKLAEGQFVLTERRFYRNIHCNVYSKTIRPLKTDIHLNIEVLIPETGVVFGFMKNPIFCIKVKATSDTPVKNNDGSVGLFPQTSFVLDYFNIEPLEGDKGVIDRGFEFNLPLGQGCSKHLQSITPEISSKSFSMVYFQSSSDKYNMLAYDNDAKLLRRELVGRSVSIWDLTTSLLYHINSNASTILQKEAHLDSTSQPCSVINVLDNKLSPAYRPFELNGFSIDVLRMLGADSLSFMGRGTVRDLPCLIYERIVAEPPFLFGLNNDQLDKVHPQVEKDYIVQYHLLEGNQKSFEQASIHIDDKEFWPARIVLYRRYIQTNVIEFLDQLDVYDFYWSLHGWNMKSTELFMARDCFIDEDEQLRMEMKLLFDNVHDGHASEEDSRLLAFNKYKLEYDLLERLSSNTLSISKLHIVDYHLKLRPNHVNLELVIADRRENKELLYYGEGQLANPSAYEKNTVKLEDLDETDCILTMSHVDDVTMVIYCPYSQNIGKSTCTAVYGEKEPTIENYQHTEEHQDSSDHRCCHAFRFNDIPAPKKYISEILHSKSRMFNFKFEANVPDSDRVKSLTGKVRDYHITHHIDLPTVNNYMYSMEDGVNNQLIRYIDSVEYESLDDCERICNLDASCRSFSYCSDPAEKYKCLLSDLDIKSSNLVDQLVHSTFSETQKVKSDGKEYQLKFKDHCDIRQRDYLNMFRYTDEVIRLKQNTISQFRTAPSPFDCAKISIDLEKKSTQHHFSMFAFCSSIGVNICLMDENLFAPIARDYVSPSLQFDDEIICRVYRKKYQTYFKVSSLVLKKPDEKSDFKQVELQLNSIEQCAQACWIKFGQVCHSFDFCPEPDDAHFCLINHIGAGLEIDGESETIDPSLLELRPGCLHYSRDMRLDDLRRLHGLGRHDVLIRPDSSGGGFGGFMLNLFTCLLVVGSFVYGLVLGRKLNDRMEAVTILGLSSSGQNFGRRASEMFHNLAGGLGGSNGTGGGVNELINKSRGMESMGGSNLNGANAIKMDVIRRHSGRNDGDDEELVGRDD